MLLSGKDAAKELRAFGLSGFLRERFDRLYDEHMDELRKVARRRLRVSLLGNLATVVLTGIVAALLVLALSGRIGLADAGTAAGAVFVLGERLMNAVFSAGMLYESSLFIEDFTSFVAMAPEVEARRSRSPAPAGFRRLRVEDVSFTYPSATTPAVTGVSMEIGAGEIVALVGENGSGKTTLAKLLCRLYLPHAGRVLWDELDTASADPDGLRRSVAVIFQDFLHYSLPAAENVGMGRHQRIGDIAAIRGAAVHAGADEFLAKLPKGYETVLGPEFDGGKELSVGQWQRVALARAFFRDAPFIILDEPTAALDARAEHELFESIRTLCRGRSVLLISHRFSSVRSADRIYVLDGGQGIEVGSHDELMDLGGRYAELFTLQASATWPRSPPEAAARAGTRRSRGRGSSGAARPPPRTRAARRNGGGGQWPGSAGSSRPRRARPRGRRTARPGGRRGPGPGGARRPAGLQPGHAGDGLAEGHPGQLAPALASTTTGRLLQSTPVPNSRRSAAGHPGQAMNSRISGCSASTTRQAMA